MKNPLGILFLSVAALAAAQTPYKGFDPKRDAAADLKKAIAEAKRTNRRVLIDVGGNWCGWCRKLDEFFERDKAAKAALDRGFVLVKVNWSPENENRAVLGRYPKVPAYPHFFVLEKDGRFLHSQGTGELETGNGHDHAKVMAFLKKWSPK